MLFSVREIVYLFTTLLQRILGAETCMFDDILGQLNATIIELQLCVVLVSNIHLYFILIEIIMNQVNISEYAER